MVTQYEVNVFSEVVLKVLIWQEPSTSLFVFLCIDNWRVFPTRREVGCAQNSAQLYQYDSEDIKDLWGRWQSILTVIRSG